MENEAGRAKRRITLFKYILESPKSMSPSKKTKTNPTANLRLSMAVENYLLSIFQLEEQGIRVTPTSLSEQLKRLPEGEGLGTSLPSIGAMIRRMVRDSLLANSDTKTIVFTSDGKNAAQSMVRRHRLAKRLVVDLLGLELYKAHEEAHRLEHAISHDLENKINDRLNNPTTCPFGHPIPGNGYIPEGNIIPLNQAKTGTEYNIDRIPDEERPLLEYLVKNGFIPNQTIVVKDLAPYRGIINILCNDTEITVSYDVASRIWVRL